MHYILQLQVRIDPGSTSLKAIEHADAVARDLFFEVSRGLLTRSSPQTIVLEYSISVIRAEDAH